MVPTYEALESELHLYSSPHVATLAIQSRDIISSALQKSLRRANRSCALAAAHTFITADATAFWRRLVGIVFEDFGLSDVGLTNSVVAAAKDGGWRKKMGGDWKVAAFLIESLVKVPGDRRIDDLYMLGIAIARYDQHQKSVDSLTQPTRELVQYASALSQTCERPVPRRSFYSVVPKACENALLLQTSASADLREMCSQGRKTSQCLLPVLLPAVLHSAEISGQDTILISAPARSPVLHGILGAAIDGYTRLGRHIVDEIVRETDGLGGLLNHAVGVSRAKAAAQLLFCVEGGVLARRLTDPTSDELRRAAMGCWSGLPIALVPFGLETMNSLLPQINARRAELLNLSQTSL